MQWTESTFIQTSHVPVMVNDVTKLVPVMVNDVTKLVPVMVNEVTKLVLKLFCFWWKK